MSRACFLECHEGVNPGELVNDALRDGDLARAAPSVDCRSTFSPSIHPSIGPLYPKEFGGSFLFVDDDDDAALSNGDSNYTPVPA